VIIAPFPVVPPQPVQLAPADISEEGVTLGEHVEDIDADDADAVTFVPDLVQDIFKYLRSKERLDRPSADYITTQIELTEGMRTTLVHWMVEVHLEFGTLAETLYLSVSLMDRYFEKTPNITRNHFQLVGLAAMFTAAKYEETMTPGLAEYVSIADDIYHPDEILETENDLLQKINWNMSVSTPLHFLRRYSKAGRANSRLHTLSKYFIELTLPEYCMLAYLPSLIAASSVFIARKMTGTLPYWNPTLTYYTGYTEEDLRPCAKSMINILRKEAIRYAKNDSDPSRTPPITRKYSDRRFYSVAPVALARVSRNAKSKALDSK